MLEKSINDIKGEITKLEKQYLFSSKELNGLKNVLVEKVLEHETKIKKLCSFEKEFEITGKKYQAAKDKISFLRKQIPLMGDSLYQIDRELQETEKKIKSLNRQKQDLRDNISKIEQNRHQTTEVIFEKEKENSEILSGIEKAQAEKKKILNEISEMLSKVSGEKIRSEKELDEFSMDFAKLAGEREQIRTEFNEKEKQIDSLVEKLALIEEEYSSLTDIIELEKNHKILATTVGALKKRAETGGREIFELEKERSEKNKKFSSLVALNAVNKESIFSLEKEVKLYDELVLKVQDNENKLTESNSSIEKAYSDLNELFAGNIRIEQAFI